MINMVKCLAVVVLISSCKEKTVKLGKDISFQKEENVHYGNDSEQILDFYLPHQESSKKKDVFMIIHGGSWRGGDKSQLTFFTLSMMKKFPDYIFVNLNYRLATATSSGIPNQTDDIENAIQYVEKKLKYHPKFILLGNSAGAHLSMLYAYHFDAKKRVKAVVNIVGPSDLSDPGFEKYTDYSFVKNYLVNPKAFPECLQPLLQAPSAGWILLPLLHSPIMETRIRLFLYLKKEDWILFSPKIKYSMKAMNLTAGIWIGIKHLMISF
ncbi:alpha/beta hydrolase fold [Chryseobacterium oleae]|uniref:Alpha/beta hydrolase fold n=2 Tax=Chryseobacterium oleae TaxID=491207 RepID=A0A1I4ZL84_CHROL|nr:alpha/beta hydrolase fold [Chryseobacterium oleae]